MAKHGSPPCDGAASGASTHRRALIVGGAALAAGFAGSGETAAAAGADPSKLEVQPGDFLEIVRGPRKGERVRADALEIGAAPFECFPVDPATGTVRRGHRLNRMLVLRLDPSELSDATVANAADGALVFSAICTHKGCTIKSWMAEERNLRCHCHLSQFDARSAGDVRNGPAKHQLPMVPLALDAEGFVVAAGGFTSAPGGKTK